MALLHYSVPSLVRILPVIGILERTVLAVQRDAASASSLAAIHAGTGPPEGSLRRVSRDLATSSFGWSGAHADYTTRMNLKVKF